MMKSLASYVELELYEEQTVSKFLWGNVLLKCRVEHESNNLNETAALVTQSLVEILMIQKRQGSHLLDKLIQVEFLNG